MQPSKAQDTKQLPAGQRWELAFVLLSSFLSKQDVEEYVPLKSLDIFLQSDYIV